MATLTPLIPANGTGVITSGTDMYYWQRASGSWSVGGSLYGGQNLIPNYVNDPMTSSEADGDIGIGMSAGAQSTTVLKMNLSSTDPDFYSMDTLRIHWSTKLAGTYSDDTGWLYCDVRKSDGTVLAESASSGNKYRLHEFNKIGTQVWGTNGAPHYDEYGALPFTLTSAGSSASKTDWDNAYVEFEFYDSRNMGSDAASIILVDFELTGTYTSTSRPTIRQDRFPRHIGAKITSNHW